MKPHLKRSWCIAKIDGRFLAQMERILYLYALPYDPLYLVVCFDERPCFLIGDLIAPFAAQPGKTAKEHYAYSKHGCCALLAAVEPLSGQRLATVFERRTKKEYAFFLKELASAYPNAIKIRLIQDNLNTHNASSLYETFPAEKAFELAQRFEFNYTPKSASWLNMIEIEFSALSKQCLNRRIPCIRQLEEEVIAIVKERCEKKIKLNWQFSIEMARSKLNSKYQSVNSENLKYCKT